MLLPKRSLGTEGVFIYGKDIVTLLHCINLYVGSVIMNFDIVK